MKIIFVYPFFLPNIGGTEIPMYYFAKELVKRGHEVTIYTNNVIDFKPAKLKKEEVVDGILVKRYNFLPLPLAHAFLFSPSIIPELSSIKADVFHIFAASLSFIPLASFLAAKIRRIPLVLYPQYYPDRHRYHPALYRRIRNIFVDRVAKVWIVKKADFVIALTEKEAEFYRKQGIKNVEVIREPVSLLQSPPQHEIFKVESKYKLKEASKILLFVGRIIKIKGVDVLIRSFSKVLEDFTTAKLLIVGPDQGYLSYCQELAQRLKCDKNVIFTGGISDSELACLYQLANVVILPSAYEGYGRVIIETWSFKKPVITTKTVGLAELVSPKRGILVDYGDSDALSKAIIKLLQDEDLAKAMGDAGYQLVKKEITWEKAVDKLEEIYSLICNKRAHPKISNRV